MADKKFGTLQVQMSDEVLLRHQELADELSLPLEGVVMLQLTEQGIASGDFERGELKSAHEHLVSLADRIETNGLTADEVLELAAKLRILANFATTLPVPVEG